MRHLHLGFLAPLLLAAFCLVDGAARLVPIDVFAFRGWETMMADPAPTGPFGANRSFHNRWSYGDLASLGNYPALRQYREERFTTDAYGYRNPPELAAGEQPLAAILLGDSFGAGAGNSDPETLPAQLGGLLGAPVYNLSGGPLPKLADIRAAARRLRYPRGVLLYELFERNGPPPITPPGEAMFKDLPPSAVPSWAERAAARLENLKISRAEILAARWKKALLAWARVEAEAPPNPDVVVGTLDDGSPLLLLRHEVHLVASDRPFPPDFFLWLSGELARDQLRLVVVLVPSKYSVYAAHLRPQGLPPPTTAPLARLEAALEAAGVPTVNLTLPLRQAAEAAWAEGTLLWWRDDSHWNARGIRVAAEAIARRLQADAGPPPPGR